MLGERWWRDVLLRRMLAGADAVTGFAFAVAIGVGGASGAAFWAALIVPLWLVIAKVAGLYDRDSRALRHLTVDELPSLVMWVVMSVGVTFALIAVTPAAEPSSATLVRSVLVAALVAGLARWLARALWRRVTSPERTVVFGEGAPASAVRRKLELFPDIHAEVVAELTMDEAAVALASGALPPADRLVVASDSLGDHGIGELVALCRANRIKLSVVPPARGYLGVARLNRVAELPVLEYFTWDVSRSTILLKRAIDLVVAGSLLVALSPLFVLGAVLIALDSRGPILFRQARAGLDGVPFQMLKFRTMVADAEERLPDLVPLDALAEPVFKLRRDPRVTRVGRLLRQLSIDELPQLINVLRGDMSVVGPRPEQVELVERYAPEHRFRLSVKPGMTGPMQVDGRANLSFEERLAIERDYIENLSLVRDIRILMRTLPAVLGGRGAY